MKLSGPIIFLILLAFCTLLSKPLYQEAIETDLTNKVRLLYTNQIHNTPDISFRGHHLQTEPQEITPHFHYKLRNISGAYIPELHEIQKHKTAPPTTTVASNAPPITSEPETAEGTEASSTSFKLIRTGSLISLSGQLPNEQIQQDIIALIETYSPISRIDNQTTITQSSLQAWWLGHPQKNLPDLLTKTKGYLYLLYQPEKISIKANVPQEGDLSPLETQFTQLPTGLEKNVRFVFNPPPKAAARAMIVTEEEEGETRVAPAIIGLGKISVQFGGGGSDWLHPRYNERLKKSADFIKNYPASEQKFTIGSYGTTDRTLSQKRAQAVLKKLISYGAPEERLLIYHYEKAKDEERRVQLTLSTADEINADLPEEDSAEPSEDAPPAETEVVEKAETPASPFSALAVSFGGGGSAWLHPNFNQKLKDTAELILADTEDAHRYIVGSYGTSNSELSQLRAEAVLDKLVSYDAPKERLLIFHFEKKPGKKRRVQISLATPEQVTKYNEAEKAQKEALAAAQAEKEALAAKKQEEEEKKKAEEERKRVVALTPREPTPFDDLAISFGGGGSAWLHPNFDDNLKKTAELILQHEDPEQKFTVGSYGTANPELSRLRTEAIRQKLISFGVTEERLSIGQFEKRANEKRRVQISLTKKVEPTQEETLSPPSSEDPSEPLSSE